MQSQLTYRILVLFDFLVSNDKLLLLYIVDSPPRILGSLSSYGQCGFIAIQCFAYNIYQDALLAEQSYFSLIVTRKDVFQLHLEIIVQIQTNFILTFHPVTSFGEQKQNLM